MDGGVKGVQGGLLTRRQAQMALAARGPLQGLRGQVPIPDPQFGAVRGQAQAFLAALQALLGQMSRPGLGQVGLGPHLLHQQLAVEVDDDGKQDQEKGADEDQKPAVFSPRQAQFGG